MRGRFFQLLLTAVVASAVTLWVELEVRGSKHASTNIGPGEVPSASSDLASGPDILGPRPASALPAPLYDPCRHLYSVVCRRLPQSNDPSGAVRKDVLGEVRALRFFERIERDKRNYLTAEEFDRALIKQIYTKTSMDKAQRAFNWAKNQALEFLAEQPDHVFLSSERKILRHRLKDLQLDFPNQNNGYTDEPDLLTKNGVFYESTPEGVERIRVGGAFLLNVNSWFNLVFTFAHELAHSIDPCELRDISLRPKAYIKLEKCLLNHGVIADRKDREECGYNDQTSEAFADWFGAQISARALARYSSEFDSNQMRSAVRNSVRDLCEDEDDFELSDQTQHPSPQVRIEAIFGSQPKIRELLGCPAQVQPYCQLEGTTP